MVDAIAQSRQLALVYLANQNHGAQTNHPIPFVAESNLPGSHGPPSKVACNDDPHRKSSTTKAGLRIGPMLGPPWEKNETWNSITGLV
eukprot:COSAG06_NODE_12335_length_1393_cov_1.690108_3_plen_87_part_01